MALYGDELARFNELCSAMKMLTERLMQQNDALGTTLESLGGMYAELAAWVAAGHIPAGHVQRLAYLVNQSVNAAKVAKAVAAVTAIGQLSPQLVLCTYNGTTYTPVTPAP